MGGWELMCGIKIPQQEFALKMPGGGGRREGVFVEHYGTSSISPYLCLSVLCLSCLGLSWLQFTVNNQARVGSNQGRYGVMLRLQALLLFFFFLTRKFNAIFFFVKISRSTIVVIIVIVCELTQHNTKLTTGEVVTMEMKEWGQHQQSFQIPSRIQEPRQNMLGHMYTDCSLTFITKLNPQLMLKLLLLIKVGYSYTCSKSRYTILLV